MKEINLYEIIDEFIEENYYYFKNKYIHIFQRDITKDKYFKFYIYVIFINIVKSFLKIEMYENIKNKVAKEFNELYWMDYKYFIFIIDRNFIKIVKMFMFKKIDYKQEINQYIKYL